MNRLLPLALLAVAASAQSADLNRRTTTVFGNFVVGYATLGDGGSFNESLSTLDPSYGNSAEDAGSVNGVFRDLPVQGSASFASQTSYAFSDALITGRGSATTTGDTPYDYVSLGANAQSFLRLEFTVREITPFALSGSLSSVLGVNVGVRTSESFASVLLTGTGGWNTNFGDSGFAASGFFIPGNSYRLEARASTRLNGDAGYVFNLVLNPVPEPPVWLLAGVGLLALQRRLRSVRGAS
jgi:hypothetical protein